MIMGEGMARYRTLADIMDYRQQLFSSIAYRKCGLSEK